MRYALLAVGALAAALSAQTVPRPSTVPPSTPAAGQAPLLGRITFPTSETGPAQEHFLRGVLLLHSFEYDDAILSFREAQRLNPGFVMAYWGEAMCYTQPLWRNEELSKGRAALARLAATRQARAARAQTPREKAYLDAVEDLMGPGDVVSRYRGLAGKLEAMAKAFPEDDEARVFWALALLGTIPEATRAPAVSLRAGALAMEVFKRNPQHPGAAHYILHAYDDGEHNAMALEAARTYAKIAPASSHARHMPSHAFLPLGLWDEAVASDESSFQASVDWVRRSGRTVDQQDFHALTWLHYEYLQQGRFRKAKEAEETLASALEQISKATTRAQLAPAPHRHVESEIGRGYGAPSLRNELASMRARYVLESGEWERYKDAANFENIDELFALGMSAIGFGDTPRAVAAVEHLRKASAAIPDADMREVAGIMGDELDGLVQLLRGAPESGFASLARAAEREGKRPPPIARPYPVKPAGELYAEVLLTAGRAAQAMTEYKKALQRTPRRAQSLLGLARAAQAAGNSSERQRAARELLAVWRRADAGRPELAEAKALAK